jgi:RNA polymerase sigma-70 factor (ECF subfamily)
LFYKADVNYLTEEFKIVRDEMKECICSYIKMLPANYRTVIILREYEAMPINEIAFIINCKKDTAKKLLSRARNKLKKLLTEKCQFYYDELSRFSCEKK